MQNAHDKKDWSENGHEGKLLRKYFCHPTQKPIVSVIAERLRVSKRTLHRVIKEQGLQPATAFRKEPGSVRKRGTQTLKTRRFKGPTLPPLSSLQG